MPTNLYTKKIYFYFYNIFLNSKNGTRNKYNTIKEYFKYQKHIRNLPKLESFFKQRENEQTLENGNHFK